MLELLGSEGALQEVLPLARDRTPADELVVSRAKHGAVLDGQVNDETEVADEGTVSSVQVESPPEVETQREVEVALQYTMSGPTDPDPIFPVPPAQQKSPDVVHARVVKLLIVKVLVV